MVFLLSVLNSAYILCESVIILDRVHCLHDLFDSLDEICLYSQVNKSNDIFNSALWKRVKTWDPN